MYRSSSLRSILNTGYITGLDMCDVCTEAVHCVAFWTRVTSQVWTCVKYVPKKSIPKHFEHGLHHRFGHVWSMYRNTMTTATYHPKTFFGYYTQAPGGVVGNYMDPQQMGYPSPSKNWSKSFSLSVWRSQSLPAALRNQPGTAALRRSECPVRYHQSVRIWEV